MKAAQQADGAGHLAGADRAEHGVDQRAGPAADQGQQPQHRVAGAAGRAAALLGVDSQVRCAVGDGHDGAVHGADQQPPPPGCARGRAASRCRLITTLTDPARYPAADLAGLYHERWEIETTYLELKSTILGNRVLRARTPSGIEQEIYALLVTYQALRTAIADAAATIPGTDPDRASFTIALNAARDQVILAAGIIPGPGTSLAGSIGRLVLAALMPPRRPRTSPRIVKRAMSKYNARGTPDRTTYKAAINIAILSPPP